MDLEEKFKQVKNLFSKKIVESAPRESWTDIFNIYMFKKSCGEPTSKEIEEMQGLEVKVFLNTFFNSLFKFIDDERSGIIRSLFQIAIFFTPIEQDIDVLYLIMKRHIFNNGWCLVRENDLEVKELEDGNDVICFVLSKIFSHYFEKMSLFDLITELKKVQTFLRGVSRESFYSCERIELDKKFLSPKLKKEKGTIGLEINDQFESVERIGYKILKLIGQGRFGSIFLVESLQKKFILKVQPACDHFFREERILKKLEDFPHSPTIYDVWVSKYVGFIVMDFLNPGVFCVNEIRNILKILKENFCILYVDIDPENVMSDGKRTILIDFGFAVDSDDNDSHFLVKSGVLPKGSNFRDFEMFQENSLRIIE